MSHIAAKAGVSQSTVSLVLNGSYSIKLADDTREKVLRIAQEMGYVHKAVERPIARDKIALIINGLINHDPFIEAISAVQQAAWQHNKLLAIFDQENEPEHCAALEEEICRGGYQGVIYASCMTSQLAPMFRNLSIPMVMLNGYCPELPDVPCILPADKIGAYKATSHLLQQGYKRIAILAGELWMDAANDRISGYRQALINHDICPDEGYIQVTNWSLKEAYKKTLELLALTARPEAIFCSSDYIALGCYQAILSQGLRIPDDIAVVGYDNQSISSELSPELSSVDLPYGEMGEMALHTLLNITQQQPLLSLKMKVEGELVIRQSSIRPEK
ncbi:LacI family DNA-binding transcriptional regulator [Yersinia pseudotuberculosis]|uniref:Sugar-binding transcriptional regulator, LacI family n=6 Tax=Yersinia pseudotuberculosis complex TaxID=1649845 RepID=A0A0U1R3C9_YERP3|nr:sugar-binding transcriptional regulator, LacI family [Yersinia pseudotuberculosis IP 31758]AXY36057.1 LacI family DNA-binding transcriptional regulator [Yersinia pseudotuberculosis]AYW89717.1 LacI family DNA-binding transcriptional regulator [Yersinia pseudotuberculosis]AYX02442.1 LacI family DNA-binding transcriptional regulator [Yersinia pseudotuberculosis]AYX13494.1 LacI family DNA-binding transcriptional regulator [Yersinia pseudotuberculosis]